MPDKKYGYSMIRRLNWLIQDIKCERCPDLARNCCSACVRLKLLAKDIKRELEDETKKN